MTWAVVVNTLSGEYLGPVARSTSACIIGTTLIVFGLRRREPNTGLIGELIIIAGALFYGAANEVWKLALISMVFHLVGYFGTSQANQKRQPRELSWRSLLILFLLPVVSTAVVFTASWNIPETLNFNNPRKSAVLGNVEISPPWISTENKTAAVIGVPTTTDAPNITEPNLVVKPDSNKVKKIQVDKSIVLKIIWIIL